jgi:hypothetical protein
LEPYRAYIAARFEDDRHLEATVLNRELRDAGFERAYTTLVGELRRLQLRPVCLVCAHRRGDQVTTEIDHPPGEEIQFDWLELAAADTPWGEAAYVLVGALSHSGRFRGVFCEQMTFGISRARRTRSSLRWAARRGCGAPIGWRRSCRRRRGGSRRTPPRWPSTTACNSPSARPAGAAQGKGVVEKAIQYLTKSWWRTAAVATLGDTQRSLDAWSTRIADTRKRPLATVGEITAGEPLRVLPLAAYPAQIVVERKVRERH